MSFGDRLHRLAVRGCLIAGAFLLTTAVGPCESQETTLDRTAGTQQQPITRSVASDPGASEPEPEQPKSPGPDKARSVGATDTDEQEYLANKPEDARAEADLFQQRRMADAAEDQARATWLQYERSIYEVWINGGSAFAAAFAAIAAAAAAWVSWCGIREARAQSEKELRAYIHVSDLRITDFSDSTPYRVFVEIKNFGQTPAQNVVFGFSTAVLAPIYQHTDILENIESIPRLKKVDGLSIGALGPSQAFSMPLGRGAPPSGEQAFLIRNGMLQAFVYGYVDYTDAFGQPRRTTFQYRTVRFRNISPMNADGTVVCPEGNHAT